MSSLKLAACNFFYFRMIFRIILKWLPVGLTRLYPNAAAHRIQDQLDHMTSQLSRRQSPPAAAGVLTDPRSSDSGHILMSYAPLDQGSV
jgi:hypothetical protein